MAFARFVFVCQQLVPVVFPAKSRFDAGESAHKWFCTLDGTIVHFHCKSICPHHPCTPLIVEHHNRDIGLQGFTDDEIKQDAGTALGLIVTQMYLPVRQCTQHGRCRPCEMLQEVDANSTSWCINAIPLQMCLLESTKHLDHSPHTPHLITYK